MQTGVEKSENGRPNSTPLLSQQQFHPSNEELKSEVHRQSEIIAQLKEQLAEVRKGSSWERQGRQAALNLMEDAITARKQAQLEVNVRKAAEEALREADRRKDEFLATLAHELRNPLAPISNSLHILRESMGRESNLTRMFAMLERQVNHMVRLVNDLMEVSRITRGVIELEMAPTNLAAIVQNAVELSRPQIEAGHHELTVSVPQEPIYLHADIVRVSQALANLLNNAAKYTDDNGTICLSAQLEGNEILVAVRDSGIGLADSMLDKIFDMFTQAEPNTRRGKGGLGIGLTLVKKIIEMHKGSIHASSEGIGLGSLFSIRLPLDEALQKATDHVSNPIASSAKVTQHRVLVVDDNVDAAVSLGMLLRLLGMDVEVAHEGQKALLVMHNYLPDVVFLDIGMHGMDGYEVARSIRKESVYDDVTLIALTGWGQAEDRDRTHKAGFNHHLVKPGDIESLKSVLSFKTKTTS
ncbi:MAG: hybrid sensor histidine kinase/response regulator [Gemmatales bacterium]